MFVVFPPLDAELLAFVPAFAAPVTPDVFWLLAVFPVCTAVFAVVPVFVELFAFPDVVVLEVAPPVRATWEHELPVIPPMTAIFSSFALAIVLFVRSGHT